MLQAVEGPTVDARLSRHSRKQPPQCVRGELATLLGQEQEITGILIALTFGKPQSEGFAFVEPRLTANRAVNGLHRFERTLGPHNADYVRLEIDVPQREATQLDGPQTMSVADQK